MAVDQIIGGALVLLGVALTLWVMFGNDLS